MRTIVVLLFALLFAAAAVAANGKQVSYPSGAETVRGMLYTPAKAKGKLPALVVIHEYWGLNDWVKQQASRLADEGYVALAIDLYRGQVASDPDEAHQLMRGVPEDRAKRDLRAAYDYLRAQPNVDPNRIGVIGWCMGGGYAFDLATMEPALKAAVINYGHLATDADTLKPIHAAVLGIFGAKDKGIPVDQVKAFDQQMKAQGKHIEVVIYPDAGHAFENPNNKSGYVASDAADAWKRTVAFLKANL